MEYGVSLRYWDRYWVSATDLAQKPLHDLTFLRSGGILAQKGDNWRWCFFLNLPTAGIALVALFYSLKLNPSRKLTWRALSKTFDFLGLALIMSGCACLVVGFSFASDHGWGYKATVALLAVGGTLFCSSLVNFLFTKRNAIIPPRVLKTRTTVFLMLASLLQAT